MPIVSKTLGPLHLEDLEPHRFEDLVRQLLYDFRPWKDLEATGRTGSDEGFDARATEIVPSLDAGLDDEESADALPAPVSERLWLIQCKREKAIGPTKLETYLEGLPDARSAGIHGLIFAAACDFSMSARTRFYAKASELGFTEVKLWGKAEIEDALFQPKNDHLLFAYFGVSLQTRKRTVRTAIRNRLAMKRKAKRHLQSFTPVLIRDASDDRYPYLDAGDDPRHVRGRWGVWTANKCGAFGVELIHRRHFAFIDDDGVRWDFAERMDDAPPHDDPWSEGERRFDVARSEDMRQWDGLPEENRGWYEVRLILPYESIIDIDEEGDEYFQWPHIYVQPFDPQGRGPFLDRLSIDLSTIGSWGRVCEADEANRVKVFPRKGEASAYAEDRPSNSDE